MTLDHLVLRRHGKGHTEIDKPLQENIGKIVAMNDINTGADEARLNQSLPAVGRFGEAATPVHRGYQVEFSRQAEIVHRHVKRRIMWAENSKAERHEAVAIGKRSRQQALHLAARMRNLREMRLARFRLGLRGAMEEGSSNAARMPLSIRPRTAASV